MFCNKNGQKLASVTEQLTRSYEDRFGVNYTNRDNLPRRSEIVSVTDKLLELLFPGFDQRFRGEVDTEEMVECCFSELASQICRALHRFGSDKECCKSRWTSGMSFCILVDILGAWSSTDGYFL